MKKIINSISVYISNSVLNFSSLSNKIVNSLKAGFLGFAAVLIILFFINLASFITGTNEKFGMDSLDFLLAGIGFVLQMTYSLLKSFIR